MMGTSEVELYWVVLTEFGSEAFWLGSVEF